MTDETTVADEAQPHATERTKAILYVEIRRPSDEMVKAAAKVRAQLKTPAQLPVRQYQNKMDKDRFYPAGPGVDHTDAKVCELAWGLRQLGWTIHNISVYLGCHSPANATTATAKGKAAAEKAAKVSKAS